MMALQGFEPDGGSCGLAHQAMWIAGRGLRESFLAEFMGSQFWEVGFGLAFYNISTTLK